MVALDLPAQRAGCGNDLAAAGEFIEIFDNDVGIDDDIAILQDQRRQFFQRIQVRIFIVRLARHHGGRDEFDFVDQAELDRGDPHFAGKWRGRGEGEFHRVSLQDMRTADQPSLRAKRSNPIPVGGVAARVDWFVATLLVMTMARTEEVRAHPPHAATICWRCSPRPSMPSVTTSPTLRNCGGFMPVPTPGGVPGVTTSPGSSVMNCET